MTVQRVRGRLEPAEAAAPRARHAAPPSRPVLTVAILTFRRPEQLRANLQAVSLRVREALEAVEPRILVVDNDPAGSARPVVDAVRRDAEASHGIRIAYAHEPRPGIPAARNRALDESAGSRLLAFIDDDEIPQLGWLTALVDVWREAEADAVMGRVVAQLPEGVEPWVASSEFFHRASRATGTLLPAAATGNLLLDLRSVRRAGLRFDESLGLTGGEDTIFTRLLVRAGGRIVWCQESVTLDPVVPERTTRDWVRRRAFAHGNTLQHTRERLAPTPAMRVRARLGGLAGGPARIVLGTARLAWGVCTRDPVRQQRGESQVRRGWGVLTAAMGHRFEEYRRREAER